MRTFIVVLFLLFISNSIYCQLPELVTDFNEGPENSFREWNFSGAYLDQMILLPVISDEQGEELGIITDGELSLLKDIYEGSEGSNPEGFIKYQGELYFTARDLMHDYAIWKTDGTKEGTVMVFDPGDGSGTKPDAYTIGENGWLYYNYGDVILRTDGNVHEEVFSGASLGFVYKHASYNYCAYKNGIAFLTKNDDDSFSLYYIDDDEAIELAKTEETGFFTHGFGLAPVQNGIMFSIEDSNIDGIYVYNESDQSLTRHSIDGEYKPSRRTIDQSQEKNISWIGGKGFYLVNGIEGEEELIYANDNNSAGQGEEIQFAKYGNKVVFATLRGIFADVFLIHTDGSVNGTSNLFELKPYNSDMITYNNYGFIADGVSNNFNPAIRQVDIETGTLTTVHEFDERSRNTNSIKPIGVQNSYLYFVSNLDETVGEELYRIKVNIGLSNTVEPKDQILEYTLLQRGSSFEVQMQKSTPIHVRIFNSAGQKMYSRKLHSNQAFSPNIANGMYILNVVAEDKTHSQMVQILR